VSEVLPIWVAVLRLDLTVPGARSLKDRRQVVRSLKERLANKFGAAVAEVGDLESWSRATLAAALVSNDKAELEERTESLVRYARRDADALVGEVEKDVFRYGGDG
jgi:hypothetical protein